MNGFYKGHLTSPPAVDFSSDDGKVVLSSNLVLLLC